MHANKIKTAIPSKKEKQKLQDLRQQQRNLQKPINVLCALQELQYQQKKLRKIELNEMETRRKIKAMIT